MVVMMDSRWELLRYLCSSERTFLHAVGLSYTVKLPHKTAQRCHSVRDRAPIVMIHCFLLRTRLRCAACRVRSASSRPLARNVSRY